MNEVLEKILSGKAARAVELGATTERVGSWIWAAFASKPSVEVRDAMGQAAFKWNAKRGVWQYAGVPCHGSPHATPIIKAKYGAVTIGAGVSGRAAGPTPSLAEAIGV